jgi:hypothetical protein
MTKEQKNISSSVGDHVAQYNFYDMLGQKPQGEDLQLSSN